MLENEIFCDFLKELGFRKAGLLSDDVTAVYVSDNNPLRVKVPIDIKYLNANFVAHQLELLINSGFAKQAIERALKMAKSKG